MSMQRPALVQTTYRKVDLFANSLDFCEGAKLRKWGYTT